MDRTTSLFARKFIAATMAFGAAQFGYAQQTPETTPITRTSILKQVLPSGDFRNVQAIIVELAPSASAPRNRHDVAVLAICSGRHCREPVRRRRPCDAQARRQLVGGAWDGTQHSANASDTQRARLLVVYIGEEGKAASVPLN